MSVLVVTQAVGFDQSFDRLIGNEGGHVNRADDPGGETNWGITWPVLRQAIGLGNGIVPSSVTIASLTREQARPIYKALFWDRGHMDEYDPAISFQVFDFAVNSGIDTALRKLQRAAGVADDGHIGPITVAAIKAKSVTDMIMLFVAERLDFWRYLSNWPAAGKGWAGRAAADLRYAAVDT